MFVRLFNVLLIIIVLLIVAMLLYFTTLKDMGKEIDSIKIDKSFIHSHIREKIENMLSIDLAELNLSKNELMKRENIKESIYSAKKNCLTGDKKSKKYIKDIIYDFVVNSNLVDEDNINNFIDFSDISNLSNNEKFTIAINFYKKNHEYDAYNRIVEENELGDHLEITTTILNKIVKRILPKLDYADKLNILIQDIYQANYGLGIIDDLRDMKIDGVSCGVNGLSNEFCDFELDILEDNELLKNLSFNSINCFYKGQTVRLSCIGFDSQKEFLRVCSNIYKYGIVNQFNAKKGYLSNDLKDGSRLTMFRPPYSMSWAFFIRKFDSVEKKYFSQLYKDKNNDMLEFLFYCMVKSTLNFILTGEQGSGKTTLLMSLISFLGENENIRTYEQIFELYLQKIFPKFNLLSLRETDNISAEESISHIKRTDGTTIIQGEIRDYESANEYIEISQGASQRVYATNHAPSTHDMIAYFKNAKLVKGNYSDERLAEEEVVQKIQFDIHTKNHNKNRFVSRITEIIPVVYEPTNVVNEAILNFCNRNSTKSYRLNEIMRYENGEYKFINKPSDNALKTFKENLTNEEYSKFISIFKVE